MYDWSPVVVTETPQRVRANSGSPARSVPFIVQVRDARGLVFPTSFPNLTYPPLRVRSAFPSRLSPKEMT